MRVITGTARGRRLIAPNGLETRPTSDKVKEGLFSAIQFDIEGRRILDLFAGSGAMGIEALSRGAKSAVFVDNSKAAIYTIEENIRSCGFKNNTKVYNTDYKSFLAANKDLFDIVFLDPPYKAGVLEDAIKGVIPFLSDYAIIIAEHPTELILDDEICGFSVTKRYKYSKTAATIFRRKD